MSYDVHLTYSKKTALNVGNTALKVTKALTGNEHFPDISGGGTNLSELNDCGNSLLDYHHETQAGNHTLISARDALKKETENKLDLLGMHLVVSVQGNVEKLKTTGYTVVQRAIKKSNNNRHLTGCTNFTIGNLQEIGALLGSAGCPSGACAVEMQVTDGDPTVEANWAHCDVFGSAAKMEIRGRVPGNKYSFRIRPINKKNERGPWSHPVTIIVT